MLTGHAANPRLSLGKRTKHEPQTSRRCDDRTLARAADGGDVRAQAEVIRRVLPRVQCCARSYSYGSTADADDAVQQALLAILEASGKFRGDASLETWASTIANRVIYRVVHRRRKEAQRLARDCSDIDRMEAPNRVSRTDELPRELTSYLNELPAKQREVLVLRHGLGHSLDEIAGLTGTGLETVRGRLRHGMATLRKLVRRELIFGAKYSRP